jgi:hypothetical protein
MNQNLVGSTYGRFCIRQPCLLTDQEEISNIYRGSSIDASYQVSVQLAKQFQGRRVFRNRPICDWLISKKSSPLKPLSGMN